MPTPMRRQSLILFNVVALLIWIVFANWWMQYHLGVSLSKIVELGGGAVLIGSLLPRLKEVLTKPEQQQATGILHTWGRKVLSGRLIGALYAISMLVVLFVTSVRVESPANDVESVTVTYPSRPSVRDVLTIAKDKEARAIFVTSPFGGRNIKVTAAGFETTPFTVYPIWGKTVALGRDVPVAQTILFRPEHKGLVALKNRGTVQVFVVNSTGPPVLVAETTGVRASLVVGADPGALGQRVESWRTDLPCDTGEERDRILDIWKQPVVLSPLGTPALKPGAKLVVEIHARNGDLVGRTELQLGGEGLTDVLVKDVSPQC